MEKLIDNKAVGRRLRLRRDALGITRDKLAEAIDVTPKFVQDIEYGNKGMSTETLARLSEVLGLTTDYILKGIVDEEGQDIERQAVKNNILGSLKVYDNDQLKIMDQVCRLLVEGKPSESYAVFAVGGCIGPVEADKNDKTKVEKQGESVIISDENADGQEVGSESVIETDWNKVDKLKEKYPEMITFTDVPEGMEFVSVEVNEESCNMINISYCFSKNDNNILVLQEYYTKEKQQTQLLESTDEYIEYKGYKIIIKQESKKLIATVNDKKCMFDVIGSITEDEVFDIVDKIKAS